MDTSLPITPAAASNERLPFRTKLIFGLGEWGNSSAGTIFAFFFSFFLTDIARLDPLYAAPVLLIGGLWDAINDPLVGVISDRTRTRWGRRRPFFLFTAIPYAVFFIMLWWVPPWNGQLAKAAYYAMAYIFADTAITFMGVPYASLTPELTQDYDERTRLNGYRMVVSMLGGLVGAVSVPLIVRQFIQPKTGYLVSAIIFGSLAALPCFLLFFGIRERFFKENVAPSQQPGLLKVFITTLRNRPFRYAAGIYLTAWVAINLIEALFQYFITYWMRMPDQLEIMLALVQIATLIFIPFMVFLSNRLGKQKAYLVSVSWWVLVMISLSFLPPKAKVVAYFLATAAGVGVAAAHVVPWSIFPDVIEVDELATGERREGVYYGLLIFLQKGGTAMALAFMQFVLHLTGYTPGVEQSQPVLWAIRFLMGPFAALLLLLSMWSAWRYPIDRLKHAELRATLAKRKAGGG